MEEGNKRNLENYKGNHDMKIIRENHLDFLYELYLQGVEIGDKNVELLKKNNYIKVEAVQKAEKADKPDYIKENFLNYSNEKSKKADSQIDIILSSEKDKFVILTDSELEERKNKHGFIFEGRTDNITRDEWMPKSNTEHEKDFIDWVNSINNLGFQNRIQYRKFTLYVQQAYTWLQEKGSFTDYEDEEDREDYKDREMDRCFENSLYFLNKYIYYKEGDDEDGKTKYESHAAHEVMAYLNDCGYSSAYAKGRQMAATTTLMALNVKDVVFKKNYFMKFITEDKEKAEEIFEDKLKFAFSELPYWMKPEVSNERENLFKIGKKAEKGTKEGVGSKILVVAPKRTAVAGGAPQKVMIDEAGNIPILGKMIDNARPTMLKSNKKTGKIEIKRMLVFWGTGGSMDRGGKAFETEFMALIKQWQDNDYSSCVVPVFFNWTCRPFSSQEDYDREKKVAYSKVVSEQEKDSIIEFHQSWPETLSDVFRTNAKTLVPEEFIKQNTERIAQESKKIGSSITKRGYFEPIYDYDSPAPEGSDVPYRIIGAEFVPTEDFDARASVEIFMEPKMNWKNRYFQGTDPIDTDTGLSNMASVVWDKYYKCPSAILDWRTRDPKDVFLQTMLLGIYYDTSEKKRGIKELVESNRGTSYTQYKEAKGFGSELVLNYQLPLYFKNQTTINEGIGIDNKGIRNTMIITRLHEMTVAFGDRNYFYKFFDQLSSFTCNISDKGKEMWGPMNKKYFKDDVLFGTVFSYICAELAFPELQPVSLEHESKKTVVRYKQMYDKNYNLIRVPVKERI